MKSWQIILLCFLVAIPFSIYLIQNSLWDTDSYFHLLVVCHKANFLPFIPFENELVLQTLFSLIPCNIFLIKIILFLLCFSCVFLVAKIGELFDEKNGWLAGSFCILFTHTFVFKFFKFENDLFSYPFLFIGLWFLLAGKKDNCLSFKLTALLFIGIAGLLWKGSILYLVILGFSFWPALLLAIGIIFFVGISQLIVFLPNFIIKENIPLNAGFRQFLLLLGFLSPIMIWPEAIFLVFVGLLNSKFFFLATPFLGIGTMQVFVKQKKIVKILLLLFGILIYCWFLWQVLQPQLTLNDWKAIDFAIQQSKEKNKPLQNDWGIGYQIAWHNGNPAYWGGGSNPFLKNTIIISKINQDCELLQRFDNFGVWNC